MTALVLLAAACSGVSASDPGNRPSTVVAVSEPIATTSTSTSTTAARVSDAPKLDAPSIRATSLRHDAVAQPTEPVPPRMGPLQPRVVAEQVDAPFAVVGDVTLYHPSTSVELIGFHESNHDGARQMEPLDTAVAPFTMASRERGTGSRTAADIVVEPGVAILAPVTGTVLRAGSYTLYCDYRDHFAVIEPDAQPGWEVKILHFLDLQVRAGDRVEAGVTVLGSGPRSLAFRSQVDDATAAPSWPHVHVEVVDPSIPDRPSGTSC